MATPFARRNHLKLFRKQPTVQPAGTRTLDTGIPDQMRFYILVHVSKHTGAPAPPHCSNSPKMAPKASLGVISLTGVLTIMLFVRCGHSAHSTSSLSTQIRTVRSLTVTVFVQDSTHQEVFVTEIGDTSTTPPPNNSHI
uniref:Uncharacterized protein n=2 Tax=Timema TaxID=61471 RepID=A0A7R9FFJ8_9NEOP|nr:unnamed protein product [Timema bartmani]CAD7452685.1 unnamed protein product [Timema tahoe]